jgi:dihydroorotase
MMKLIKNGRVLDASICRDEIADVLIEDGKIKAVDRDISKDGAEIIDARGCWVVPGLIDMHVHFRDPGFEAKEDIVSGSRAAAAGGFTSVACMPNTKPVVDNRAVVEYIKTKADRTGLLRVFPIGAVTKNLAGLELAEIKDMKDAGIVAISDDGQPVNDAGVMRRAMEYASMFDIPVISHCEDRSLMGNGAINEGRASAILGLAGIPPSCEEVMVARDIILAEAAGAHLHIAHVSTKGSIELIRRGKERGVRVTAEAAPHHFTLTEDAVMGFDTNAKVNPPLRSSEDVEAIKSALKDGTIDAIATDHAPHTVEDKDVEFDEAAFGISGLETAVALAITELVKPGVLTPLQLVEKMALNPAKVLGLKLGTLKPGAPSDITIIDPETGSKVDIKGFESRGKNSPFNGRWLFGRIAGRLTGMTEGGF